MMPYNVPKLIEWNKGPMQVIVIANAPLPWRRRRRCGEDNRSLMFLNSASNREY